MLHSSARDTPPSMIDVIDVIDDKNVITKIMS